MSLSDLTQRRGKCEHARGRPRCLRLKAPGQEKGKGYVQPLRVLNQRVAWIIPLYLGTDPRPRERDHVGSSYGRFQECQRPQRLSS